MTIKSLLKNSTLLLATSAATLTIVNAADKKGKGEAPEPAELAVKLIESHDSNSDGSLDKTELTAALEALKEMRKGKKKK